MAGVNDVFQDEAKAGGDDFGDDLKHNVTKGNRAELLHFQGIVGFRYEGYEGVIKGTFKLGGFKEMLNLKNYSIFDSVPIGFIEEYRHSVRAWALMVAHMRELFVFPHN